MPRSDNHINVDKRLIGNKFGRWTPIRFDHAKGSSNWFYLCRCECGVEKVIRSASLINHTSQSCGCLSSERTSLRQKKPFGECSLNSTLYQYRNEASKRGLVFEITKEQFISITQKNCHYCGIPPSNVYRHQSKYNYNGDYVYSGIDRVDNGVGYIISNIVPCCKICNYAKRHHTKEEFIDWVSRVYKYSVGVSNV